MGGEKKMSNDRLLTAYSLCKRYLPEHCPTLVDCYIELYPYNKTMDRAFCKKIEEIASHCVLEYEVSISFGRLIVMMQ